MIHPTAIVHPEAKLGAGVAVGAYSIIEANVEIGDNTRIGPHVVITGHTTIGRDNRIFQFCSLGEVPQDKKYADEPTRLVIGDRNTIREFCTFNLGTAQDAGVTRMGDDNWIMAYVHVAHDCQIGSRTIFANNAQLAGHVHVDDWVIFGGFSGAHQFTRIGAHAMIAAGTIVLQDGVASITMDSIARKFSGFMVPITPRVSRDCFPALFFGPFSARRRFVKEPRVFGAFEFLFQNKCVLC